MYMYVEQSQFDLVVFSGVDLAHSRRTLVKRTVLKLIAIQQP